MATVTPNYNWPVPLSTDLVKDGADAIKDLGDAIDATVFGLPSGGLTLINTTTFSAVASQSVNDVFTSSYANYRVLLDVVGSTDMVIYCRLRASGTDNSSATYNTRRATLESTYTTTYSATATSFHFAVGRATNKSAASFDFFNPKSATQTSALGQSYEPASLIDLSGLTFTNTTQFDGFSLLPNTGTITGTLRVYGYAN